MTRPVVVILVPRFYLITFRPKAVSPVLITEKSVLLQNFDFPRAAFHSGTSAESSTCESSKWIEANSGLGQFFLVPSILVLFPNLTETGNLFMLKPHPLFCFALIDNCVRANYVWNLLIDLCFIVIFQTPRLLFNYQRLVSCCGCSFVYLTGGPVSIVHFVQTCYDFLYSSAYRQFKVLAVHKTWATCCPLIGVQVTWLLDTQKREWPSWKRDKI